MSSELHSPLSALDLAKAIERGAMTVEAAFEKSAEAIAAKEEPIRAFAHLDIDGARSRVPSARGSLAGIAVGVKDIIDTSDMPTEMGSTIWKGWRPKADAPVVSLLRSTGAAIPGKTTTTTFAHMNPTRTANPAAPGHTPGGSSSGSAAAVAAGMVPLALGTQTGGSIIRPASYCGVAGMKPSFRLLPSIGVKCFSWAMDTVGLFASGVADLAFGLAAITGRPKIDISALAPGQPQFLLVRQEFAGEAEVSAESALSKAASALSRLGHRLTETRLPEAVEAAFAAHAVIQDYEVFRSLAWEWQFHRDAIPDVTQDMLRSGEAISSDAYDNARRLAKRGRQALKDVLPADTFIVTYAAPGPAPKGLGYTGNAQFNRLWSLLGVPCISVPGLRADNGHPLGIQVIGPFGRDANTLLAAKRVESAIAR